MTTYEILTARLTQLTDRKMMIPRYLETPERWIGKKDYAANMLKGIEEEITETTAALEAIKKLRENKR